MSMYTYVCVYVCAYNYFAIVIPHIFIFSTAACYLEVIKY